jgi:hypothetical protein
MGPQLGRVRHLEPDCALFLLLQPWMHSGMSLQHDTPLSTLATSTLQPTPNYCWRRLPETIPKSGIHRPSGDHSPRGLARQEGCCTGSVVPRNEWAQVKRGHLMKDLL